MLSSSRSSLVLQRSSSGPAPGLLTYRQAADHLGVSARTVWSLVHDGQIPAIHIGGKSVRIDPQDLQRYIQESRRCHGAPSTHNDATVDTAESQGYPKSSCGSASPSSN